MSNYDYDQDPEDICPRCGSEVMVDDDRWHLNDPGAWRRVRCTDESCGAVWIETMEFSSWDWCDTWLEEAGITDGTPTDLHEPARRADAAADHFLAELTS
jgi:hypothetical protein